MFTSRFIAITYIVGLSSGIRKSDCINAGDAWNNETIAGDRHLYSGTKAIYLTSEKQKL